MFCDTYNKGSKKAPLGAFLFYVIKVNYLFVKNDAKSTNTINPINPPFTNEFKRLLKLATTSNPRAEVPVNTNHKIANGIIPIKTPESPFVKSFTILNTFFMSIKF